MPVLECDQTYLADGAYMLRQDCLETAAWLRELSPSLASVHLKCDANDMPQRARQLCTNIARGWRKEVQDEAPEIGTSTPPGCIARLRRGDEPFAVVFDSCMHHSGNLPENAAACAEMATPEVAARYCDGVQNYWTIALTEVGE
jgi:hypothetical protein